MLIKLKSVLLSCLGLVMTLSAFADDTIPAQHFFTIQHWETKHHAQVYFVPVDSLPIVDVEIMVNAGSARDDNQPGIAALTNALLGQDSKTMDADAIAASFDNVAAQFGQDIKRDYAVLSLRSLSDPAQLNPAIQTLSTLLCEPVFTGKSFLRTKNQSLQGILQQQQDPDNLASQAFFKTLYGTHPYGHDPLGDSTSLTAYTPADVQAFYQQHYVARQTTLALVGNLTTAQAKQLAEDLLGRLPEGQAAPPLPTPTYQPDQFRVNVPFPASQTYIRIGELGVAMGNPSLPALTVGNYILGGGSLVSRLFKEVRDNRGLAYNVESAFAPLQVTGPFIVASQSKNQSSNQAIQIIIDQINRFLTKGPTDLEIKQAKENLIGAFPLRFDSNASIVDQVALLGFYQLPLDYFSTYQGKIQAVSSNDIRQAFNQYVNPSELITVTVGNSGS